MKKLITEFTPTEYVVALYNSKNKPLISPFGFFMGDYMSLTPNERRKELRSHLEMMKKGERDYEPVIDLNRKFMLCTGEKKEDGSPQKRYRSIIELEPHELEFALRHKIRQREGSLNLFNYGGRRAFTLDTDLDREDGMISGFAGEIGTSGVVKSRGKGSKAQATKFNEVSIKGIYTDSGIKLADIRDTCRYSRWVSLKQGYSKPQITDPHVASRLIYMKRHPEKVKGLLKVMESRKNSIWLPIHTDEPQEIEESYSPHLTRGEQPPLFHLKNDIILARYLEGEKLYDIDRNVSKLEVVYDKFLKEMIKSGKAGFEPVVRVFIFHGDQILSTDQREFYKQMRNIVHDEKFNPAGYSLEMQGTPRETISMVYERGDDSLRVMFNPDFPPIIAKKKLNTGKVKIFKNDKGFEGNPFSVLFEKIPTYDDMTRRDGVCTEFRIPTKIKVTPDMVNFYKSTIGRHYPGGLPAFRRKLEEMKLSEKNNLVRSILN